MNHRALGPIYEPMLTLHRWPNLKVDVDRGAANSNEAMLQ
jgi:hypothetical protein